MADKNADSGDDLSSIMGFGSFGSQKKAKTFDFMQMFEQARKTAIERNQDTLAAREQQTNTTLPKCDMTKTENKHAQSTLTSMESKGRDPDEEDSDDEEVIGPPLPPGMEKTKMKFRPVAQRNKTESDSEDDEEEDPDEADDNPVRKIPQSHEVVLHHGTKTVSALGMDPSGARLVTGGYDFEVNLWDFAGMDASLQSFRTIKPCESHNIKGLEYSITGDAVLVVAGNSQAKVLDRDGYEKFECAKGYPYIADMASTKGHTAMLNGGCWNPKVRHEFMTCSNDGSVRLWHMADEGRKHKYIMKPRNKQGKRATPTACTYSRDGVYIAAACQDGSIQMWDHRKNFVNVALKCMEAHMNGTDTSCLNFSYDGKVLASRGGDDTLKLWDIRQFKKPLCVAEDLFNLYPVTDCGFSPDDKLVFTGVSVRKGESDGKLMFFDRDMLQRQAEILVSDTSVVRCLWHPKLNQVVVGSGDGDVKIYYDPDRSHNGAKLCVVKTKRKVKQMEIMASRSIITPYALPMFRQNKPTTTKKQEEKDRKDPVKSHRPDLPIHGPGSGGRLATKGGTLSQYVVQNLILRKPDDRDKDPRAAILRHAEEAEKNPMWVAPAYAATQPKPIFDAGSSDESEDDKDDSEPLWKKKKLT